MMDAALDYQSPGRYLRAPKPPGWKLNIGVADDAMRERLEFLFGTDPMMGYDEAAELVMRRYGNFSCRLCYSQLVLDGKNGSGTTELLCRKCKQKMSLYNTFELSAFRYRKVLAAFIAYVHCGSAQGCSATYGLGKDLFNEMRMSLPDIQYSVSDEPDMVEYDGTRYAVAAIDMMYKGRKGLMLGVSGGLKFGNLGNEDTGEGLDEFFDAVESRTGTDRVIFIMDMKMSVARRILDRWGERAVIVMQSHRVWGDVFVYFHRERWYTLHLRTDAFTDVSVKRDERLLLPPGIVELYEGVRGVTHRNPLRKIGDDEIVKLARDCIEQIRTVDWEANGRVDFVMASRMRDLNSMLKELRRRKKDTAMLVGEIDGILSSLKEGYRHRINRAVKRKIVNAWKPFSVIRESVNELSVALLGEGIPEQQRSTRTGERKIRLSPPSRLIYRGPPDQGPQELAWVIGLMKRLFTGKEITTNACEGTFGNMGTLIRSGKSILLQRALTKAMLKAGSPGETASWFNANYPMADMGRRGARGNRRKLAAGKSYRIVYRDRSTVKTERTIDIISRKRKYVVAYCHLRNEVRTFKRGRIESITTV